LHVVLATQRVQPGAGAPDLTGHQRKRDQAACVVGAVHVLRDAHAPQDHRSLGSREQPGDFADRLRLDATDGCHRFGRITLDVLAQVVVADRAAVDEAFVDQAFRDDDVHHRVEQRHVGVGLELQVAVRQPVQVGLARVADDELGAVLDGVS
jgi:hypothetical protein